MRLSVALGVPRFPAATVTRALCVAIAVSVPVGCLGWLPATLTEPSRLPREMKPPPVPSIFEGESVIGSTTYADRKVIAAKSPPDIVVADDGSRCFVTSAELTRLRIGTRKWCLWVDPRPDR